MSAPIVTFAAQDAAIIHPLRADPDDRGCAFALRLLQSE
jgi:hypothetical protein